MIKKSFDTPFPARKWGVSLLLAAAPLQQDMECCRQQQGNNENFEPTVRRKQSVSSIPVFSLTQTTQKMHFYGVMVKGLGNCRLPISNCRLEEGVEISDSGGPQWGVALVLGRPTDCRLPIAYCRLKCSGPKVPRSPI